MKGEGEGGFGFGFGFFGMFVCPPFFGVTLSLLGFQ